MAVPAEAMQQAEDLALAYRRAWTAIVEEQEKLAANPLAGNRRRRLTELRRTVERELITVDRAARAWLQERLPRVYALGAHGGAEASGTTLASFTTVDRDALQRIASDTFDDLLKATRFTRRDTKRFIREAGKRLSSLSLTRGDTAQQAARAMMRELIEERGITSVIYRNGSRHGLAEYAEMVLRTKTATAYNVGTVNGAQTVFFEVFDGPGCGWDGHASADHALGKIVTADEATAFPISHPNCQRSFGPRPDITTRAAANQARTSLTDAQVRDQRLVERAREARVRRRAQRRRRLRSRT